MRDRGTGSIRPTVVQLPTRPASEYTAVAQRRAKEATYTGRLADAARLYRAAVTEDGVIAGLMSTIGHGILGLPMSFQGDAAQCAALADAEGTPGEYGQLFPQSEAAQVFADGVGFGLGLGQFVATCWRCEGDEIDPDGACETCGACVLARPPGQHIVTRLRWWDPQYLRQDPYSRRWFLQTLTTEIEIRPGDGEWFLYTPYPEVDAWRHGPWLYLTIAFVFSRDSVFDRQRHSEVLSPVRVMAGQKATTKEGRKKALAILQAMQRDNQFVLPEGYDYKVVESTGKILDIYSAIIAWAKEQASVGLTGSTVSIDGTKGFTSANVYERVANWKRAFYASTWCGATRKQGLVYWGLDNYGTRKVPTTKINVESPEDAKARADSYGALGDSLGRLKEGADKVGVDIDQTWTIETFQRANVRVTAKIGKPEVTSLALGVDAVAAVVRGGVALKSLGLDAIGDGRDDMTIVELEGRAAAGIFGPAPYATPAPSTVAPAAAPILGDAAGREEDDGPAEPEYAAQLASSLNEHVPPIEKCRHGASNNCRKCGIKRQDTLVSGVNGGEHSFKVNWVPISAPAAPAPPPEVA